MDSGSRVIFTVVTPVVRRSVWVWEAKPEKAGTARENVPADKFVRRKFPAESTVV
jgi:hypothetical protein